MSNEMELREENARTFIVSCAGSEQEIRADSYVTEIIDGVSWAQFDLEGRSVATFVNWKAIQEVTKGPAR